jgi:K+-transporting ATPase ATPase C chain
MSRAIPIARHPSAREKGPPVVRPTIVLLALFVVMVGLVYPGVFTEVAQHLSVVTEQAAGGDLLRYANGTAYASALIGQNVTNHSLFWLRPSLIDYQPFTGAGGESPYGPTDPALVNLTLYYIALYGLSNTSVPLNLVAPSASGLDPDLTPEAALVQVPRVAFYSGLSEAFLTSLVAEAIVPPYWGTLGPAYVNVIQLDIALIPYLSGPGSTSP